MSPTAATHIRVAVRRLSQLYQYFQLMLSSQLSIPILRTVLLPKGIAMLLVRSLEYRLPTFLLSISGNTR